VNYNIVLCHKLQRRTMRTALVITLFFLAFAAAGKSRSVFKGTDCEHTCTSRPCKDIKGGQSAYVRNHRPSKLVHPCSRADFTGFCPGYRFLNERVPRRICRVRGPRAEPATQVLPELPASLALQTSLDPSTGPPPSSAPSVSSPQHLEQLASPVWSTRSVSWSDPPSPTPLSLDLGSDELLLDLDPTVRSSFDAWLI
jgi:hypothetical protein